jgi:CRP/FNR family transcriptional regulator, cyclic AMP receptor protein
MDQGRLRDVPFFSSVSKQDLAAIAQQTDEIDVPAGQVLAREGDFGAEFFVIDSGKAEVTKGGERIAELGAGDFFGEMALLDEERRTATVTATTPMSLIVMTRANFRALDRSLPQVHETVAREIAERRAHVS